MAYQMLRRWREGEDKKGRPGGERGLSKGPKSRLLDALEAHKCEHSAEFLRVGEQQYFWK